jgi:cytochrome c-type biogenesis protein CcmH/NrfF
LQSRAKEGRESSVREGTILYISKFMRNVILSVSPVSFLLFLSVSLLFVISSKSQRIGVPQAEQEEQQSSQQQLEEQNGWGIGISI